MELTLFDRFTLQTILPQEGNRITLILVRSIMKKLEPSVKEIEEYEIKGSSDGRIGWNEKGSKEAFNITFAETELEVIREQFKKLDLEGKLKLELLDLSDKFIQS